MKMHENTLFLSIFDRVTHDFFRC